MASTMLHEKCCNTVLQIGAPVEKCKKRDLYEAAVGTLKCISADLMANAEVGDTMILSKMGIS